MCFGRQGQSYRRLLCFHGPLQVKVELCNLTNVAYMTLFFSYGMNLFGKQFSKMNYEPC